MRRMLSGVIAGAALLALAVPGAHAGRKAKKKKVEAPVEVTVENTCKVPMSFTVGTTTFEVKAGEKSPSTVAAKEGEGWGYPVKLSAPQVADLGLITLAPGKKYALRFADCRGGTADLYTRDLTARPEAKSPHAAAQVRFRARQHRYVEYRSGKTGRFKSLSIAMTRYKESPEGDLMFTLRLRAAKRGPVLKIFKKTIKIEAGHRYLIEANLTDRNEILFKQEDEGWTEKKG